MRISWIDNLKGIGILLIVLGHCYFPEGNLLTKYIFSFHVVLFFILSGLLFNDKKHNNFLEFFKNKFFRLILTFFVFNIVMFALMKLIGEYPGTRIYDFLVGVFYGDYLGDNGGYMNNTGGFNITNTSTWFLTALFSTSIFYFVLNKLILNKKLKILFLFLSSILIFIYSKYFIFRFPWGVEVSFMVMLFYGLAHTFRKEIFEFVDKINYKFAYLLPFILGLNLYLLNSVNVSTNYYGNYFLFLLDSFLGFSFFVTISKYIGSNKILNFLGQNSIIILGFEWIKILILKNISFLSFGYLAYKREYLVGFYQFFLTILILFPIIILINKFMFMLSKPKKTI